MLKQQTAAGRVFRAAEYEVGVAQARALGTPDRYDTVSTFLLKYLKLLLDFSAQILLDFSAQIFSNHFSNFLLKLFKSLLNLSIHVEGKSASRGGLALNGKQFAPSVLFNCSVSSPNLRSERQDVESIDVAPPRTASSAYSLVDPTATALPQFPPPHATPTFLLKYFKIISRPFCSNISTLVDFFCSNILKSFLDFSAQATDSSRSSLPRC